jgi:hypothetical protein
MALINALRAGVKIAGKTFDSVKLSVTYHAWIGQTAAGDANYKTVKLRAIVEQKLSRVKTVSGQEVPVQASLTFLDALPSFRAETGHARVNPVDPRDIVVLPDGTTGPLVSSSAPVDPGTNAGLVTQAWMGA